MTDEIDEVDEKRIFKCVCGETLEASILEACAKDWIISEKNGVYRGTCPTHNKEEREKFKNDVQEWERRGSPRGDN